MLLSILVAAQQRKRPSITVQNSTKTAQLANQLHKAGLISGFTKTAQNIVFYLRYNGNTPALQKFQVSGSGRRHQFYSKTRLIQLMQSNPTTVYGLYSTIGFQIVSRGQPLAHGGFIGFSIN